MKFVNLPCIFWLVLHSVEVSLFVIWLTNSNLNIVFGWLLSFLSDKSVGVTGSASEDFVLFWYMPGITWQVILFVLDECLSRHF